MALREKIKIIDEGVTLTAEEKELLDNALKKNYAMQDRLTNEIHKFINEFHKIAEEKGLDKDLVVFDGALFLKDFCEINIGYVFDGFIDSVNMLSNRLLRSPCPISKTRVPAEPFRY